MWVWATGAFNRVRAVAAAGKPVRLEPVRPSVGALRRCRRRPSVFNPQQRRRSTGDALSPQRRDGGGRRIGKAPQGRSHSKTWRGFERALGVARAFWSAGALSPAFAAGGGGRWEVGGTSRESSAQRKSTSRAAALRQLSPCFGGFFDAFATQNVVVNLPFLVIVPLMMSMKLKLSRFESSWKSGNEHRSRWIDQQRKTE